MLQPRRRRSSLSLIALFLGTLGLIATAQDLTNYLTPDVARVGSKLACRCGGCRMTVGNCPMIGCDSADPMRRRVYTMLKNGMTDDAIVKQIVQEQGVVALSGQQPLPLIAWVMPGIVLVIGFAIWSAWVKRNRKPQVVPVTTPVLERYRDEIERELDEGDAK